VSWISHDVGYWQSWLDRSNDAFPATSADNFYHP